MRTIDVDALKKDLNMADNCDDCPTNWKECEYDTVYSKKDFCQWLDDAPTIEPEQKWILCEQRMPEEREWIGTKRFGTTISDEVYVTFENPKGERFAEHLSFQNGKLSDFDQRTIDVCYKGSKPIAWMPIPEPYKGENE